MGSLMAILQYVDEGTAFRFMQMMGNRLRAANAVVHFHLDPDAHSEQTVAKFRAISDAIVKVADGEVTVKEG